MSTQKGNDHKKRGQKYQNRTSFRNDLHDSSKKTKEINQLDISGVCSRCKAIIDWKIKFKKYKPLTQSKKCVKCGEKAVKNAYFTVCAACSSREGVCGKCGQHEVLVESSATTEPHDHHHSASCGCCDSDDD